MGFLDRGGNIGSILPKAMKLTIVCILEGAFLIMLKRYVLVKENAALK